jgi:hypothetical protein
MECIHDIFPPDNDYANDPQLEKKLLKQDGKYDVLKTLLGVDFDSIGKTLWLEAAKQEKLPINFIRGSGWRPVGMGAYRSSSLR